MRPRFTILSFVPLAALLSGCLSTQVTLDYVANPGSNRTGPPVFSAGIFKDLRDEDEPTHLGTVKTPIGTPFEQVYLRVPAEEVVQNAFLHALAARGMIAKSASPRFILEGDIQEFYCQLLTRPYATAKLRVDLVDLSTNRVLYRHTYQAERQATGYLPGSGDPVPNLRDLASRALQDVVDHAIDDQRMRERMENPAQEQGHSKDWKRRKR